MKQTFFMLLLLASGCAPEPARTEIHATVLSSVGEILHPSEVYVRFDEPANELTVFEKLSGTRLTQGSAAAGNKLAVKLGERACEVESGGPRIETDSVEKNRNQETPANDPGFRTRNTTVVSVTLRCADGLPPPGVSAPPSVPGWTVTLWMLGAIALGLLLGFAWATENAFAYIGVLLAVIVVLVGSVVMLWSRLDGGLVLSLPFLALVSGASGAAAIAWPIEKGLRSKVVSAGFVAGGVAGPAIVAVTTPLWAGGAPLVAALIVFVWFVVFAVIGVSGDGDAKSK